jgi:hypothetical protein
LKEDSCLPLQQKIEPVLRPVYFQKSIHDQDDENNSGEDCHVDK